MAWSSASISAADLALLAADKPILGSQSIPVSPLTPPVWYNSGSTTDRTEAEYPARRAYDGFGDLVTRPTTASVDKEWYFYFETSAAGISFDFIAILGHNFGTCHSSGALTITLQIADASNFVGGVTIPVHVTTGSSNNRIIALSLYHTGSSALAYSAVRYARLKIVRASNNFTPAIGELILGSRLQMQRKPDVPYDQYAQSGENDFAITQGGVIHSSIYSKGRRVLSAQWTEDSSTVHTQMIAWHTATAAKSRPFVWIENPGTSPSQWGYMVSRDSDLSLELVSNPSTRSFSIEAEEQGPEAYYLSGGTY